MADGDFAGLSALVDKVQAILITALLSFSSDRGETYRCNNAFRFMDWEQGCEINRG